MATPEEELLAQQQTVQPAPTEPVPTQPAPTTEAAPTTQPAATTTQPITTTAPAITLAAGQDYNTVTQFIQSTQTDPNASRQGSVPTQAYLDYFTQQGFLPQLVGGMIPASGNQVLGDGNKVGPLETESYNLRSNLPATGTARNEYSYWDADRGVQVHAPQGSHFELYSGGGVRLVKGLISSGAAQTAATTTKTTLFDQPTQGVAGSTTETQATPGIQTEQLAIQPIAGKEIERYGQTVKNPETGVDVYAKEGNILIQYKDGTVEERPVSQINQPGTSTTPIGQFGPTAQDLGITRQTEIKGGAGPEITRAPITETVAQMQARGASAQEIEARIAAEGGLAPTSSLEFIGSEYTDQKTGQRRVAAQGNAFYQDPTTDIILERPASLEQFAKPTTSPSVLAERAAAAGVSGAGALPTFSRELSSALAGLGIAGDESGLLQSLRDRPIPSIQDLYTQIQTSQGVPTIMAQLKLVMDQMKELDDKYAKDKAGIDENPWLSESLRDRKQDALAGKYETQRSQLTNRQQLFQSLMDDARQEARFLAGAAVEQANADRTFDMNVAQLAFDRADQRFKAQMDLAQLEQGKAEFEAQFGLRQEEFALQKEEAAITAERKNLYEVQGGLYDISTGQWVVAPKPSGDGYRMTEYERNLAILQPGFNTLISHFDAARDEDGYTSPDIYRMERSNFSAIGVKPEIFDDVFATQLSPAERTNLLGDVYRVPTNDNSWP